ncbi:MAG: HAD family hydrolase [Candidatus Altimarinota bacterium]
MKKNPIQTAILDFDNTIANWVKYAGKAYPAMAEALAKSSGIDKEIIIEEMIKVYAKHQTVEYVPLVQEMEIFKDHPDQKKFIVAAKNAFTKQRKLHLELYDGILPLMEELKAREIQTIILTDAPYMMAAFRATQLKIRHLIDVLIGLKSPDPNQIHEPYRRAYQDFPFKTYVSEHEKPHTKLQEILSEVNQRTMSLDEIESTTILAGDNQPKDIQLAVNYKLDAYHCQYGHPDPQDLNDFRVYSPSQRSSRNVSMPTQAEPLKPAHPQQRIIIINHPDEILADLRNNDFSIQR